MMRIVVAVRIFRRFLWCLLLSGALNPSVGAQISTKNWDAAITATIAAEYNDNLFLENEQYQAVDRDYILRLIPTARLTRALADHQLSMSGQADYMRGMTTNYTGFNVMLDAILDLKFSGGLAAKLKEAYQRIEQDWNFQHEAGVIQSQSNAAGVEASYPLGQRLKAVGEYEHGWGKYEEGARTTYLNSDTVQARLYFPITWKTEGFGGYRYFQQHSAENEYWDYTRLLYEIGAEWQGPNRFSAAASAGYSIMEYDQPEAYQHKNMVCRLTLTAKFSETTSGKVWVGVDAYHEKEYGAEWTGRYTDDNSLSLEISRRTTHSYSPLAREHALNTTKAAIKHDMRFFWQGRLAAEGGYLRQSSFTDWEYWLGSLKFQYPVRNRIDLGLYYDYRQRRSDDDRYDYTNNRIGWFLTAKF